MPNTPIQEKCYTYAENRAVVACVPAAARSILDLGCGGGNNARFLAKAEREIDGVTISQAEAAQAAQVCRNVFIYNLENGLPPEVGTYDVIIASHVLEHICYPEALLRDSAAKLNPGGILVVALPNVMNWRPRLRLLAGKFEYEPHGIFDNTHFRWYTFRSAQSLLSQNGFEIMDAHADGYLPLPGIRRVLPKRINIFADRVACRIAPSLFGTQLIYVARPADARTVASEY
jgi:2-polyprenyl-3-methyl-5-hydroxy-6-metoxy-1,4-benzoquinol methylase